MNDPDRGRLLSRIASGYCTPFLGARACFGTLPLHNERPLLQIRTYPVST